MQGAPPRGRELAGLWRIQSGQARALMGIAEHPGEIR